MIRNILLLVVSACAVAAPAQAWERSAQRAGRPRVLNYYLTNNVTPQMLETLARWDVLVLDADFPFENPQGIARLRELHPGIVLLAYIPSNGTNTSAALRPPETVTYRHWRGCNDGNFWLYGVNGQPVSDWPGKWSTNLTPHSPRNALGETHGEWFARFVSEVVWDGGNAGWDGVFLDDVWDRVSWINDVLPSPVDGDRNGIADDASVLDAGWKATNASMITQLRQLLGPDVLIVSNGENTHYAALNGTMIEDFPWNAPADQGNPYGYAWRHWMLDDAGAYLRDLETYNASPGNFTVINARWSGTRAAPNRTGRFEAHKRFCLASALLGDGYFSFDASQDHASLWWEPEYDIDLGEPTGPVFTQVVSGRTVWRRQFEQGTVVVNPNDLPVQPDLMPVIGAWDAYIGDLFVSVIQDPPVDEAPVPPGPGVRVSAPFPNPGRGVMSLAVEVGSTERVVLDVFDARGRLVSRAADRVLPPGRHELFWDGTRGGRLVPAGVYVARLRAGGVTETRKLHRLN